MPFQADHLKSIILAGGVAHPYEQTSEQLKNTLGSIGIQSRITNDLDILASPELASSDILVMNCVRWTCSQTPQWREEWHYEMPSRNRAGMMHHLESGLGLLALHAAVICFDDWPEFRKILGAWWEWGSSGHAPCQEHRMVIRPCSHPIVEGVNDFSIVDELYTRLRTVEPVDPLITAEWEGEEYPMLWVRHYGRARICYCALGHGVESFGNESFQRILQRSALWVAGRLDASEQPRGELA